MPSSPNLALKRRTKLIQSISLQKYGSLYYITLVYFLTFFNEIIYLSFNFLRIKSYLHGNKGNNRISIIQKKTINFPPLSHILTQSWLSMFPFSMAKHVLMQKPIFCSSKVSTKSFAQPKRTRVFINRYEAVALDNIVVLQPFAGLTCSGSGSRVTHCLDMGGDQRIYTDYIAYQLSAQFPWTVPNLVPTIACYWVPYLY